ncbi:MAG: enoyl-CoA hydratase [Nonomuraea muscovyensis]|nr:enoyl-CoA hydratase [Nonomuraea muscovyensis]
MASAEAKFGLPEPKRGLVAGAGGIMRLPRRIPYHVAMEIALTGDHYPAARLYELGLVNRITEPGAALEGALELARKIAANAPLALAATKKVIVESQDWPLEEMFERQGAIINPVFMSKDAMEGAAAFAEKRAPRWTGE